MQVLPSKQVSVPLKNVINDPNVYVMTIDNRKMPFYRISVVAVDRSGKPKGLVDVFYNNLFVVLSNNALGSKKKNSNKEIVVGMVFKINSPDSIPHAITKFVMNVAKPGNSSKVKELVKELEKSVTTYSSNVAKSLLSEIGGVMRYGGSDKKSSLWQTIKEIVLSGLATSGVYFVVYSPFIAVAAYKLGKAYYTKKKTQDEHTRSEREYYSKYKLNLNAPAIRSLVDTVQLLISNKTPLNGLLITGSTGSGKTFTVKKVLVDNGLVEGRDYTIIRVAPNNVFDLIDQIYTSKDKKLIILDDADITLTSEVHRQLLLQMLDTIPVRTVVVPRTAELDKYSYQGFELGVDKFIVKAKFIIITNLPLDKIPDNIKTRCHIVNFTFTDDELSELIRLNIDNIEPSIPTEKKIEILQILKKLLKEAGIPLTFRQYTVAITYYKMYGDNWVTHFRVTLKIDK